MSKPELDIIRSQSAEAFLRSVTKGFYDQSYTALWMYEVIGREWDELREWSEGMRTEIHPQTCTWSIPVWEWVYGFEPDESLTLEDRRRRVLSKVFGVKPINPESIRRGVSAVAGMDAKVTDLTNPYGFGITLLPDIETTPDEAILAAIQDGKITRYVREVKPAHLRVDIDIIVRVNAKPAIARAGAGTPGLWETVRTPLELPVPLIKPTAGVRVAVTTGLRESAAVRVELPTPVVRPTASVRMGAVTGLWESMVARVELPTPIIKPTATARTWATAALYEAFTAGVDLSTPVIRRTASARLGATVSLLEEFEARLVLPDGAPAQSAARLRAVVASTWQECYVTQAVPLMDKVLTATAQAHAKGVVASTQETAKTHINLQEVDYSGTE